MWGWLSGHGARGHGAARRSVAVALVAVVLGSLAITGEAAAAQSTTQYTYVSSSTATTSSGNLAMFRTGPDIASGTTVTAQVTLSAITSGAWKAIMRCYTGAGNTGVYTDFPGVDKTGAATSTIGAICYGLSAASYIYTNTASTNLTVTSQLLVVTVNDPTAAPSAAPTAGPLPTGAVGTPAPTAPPDTGSFDAECGDGQFSVPDATHMYCHYSSNAGEEGGANNAAGPLCRAGWTLQGTCKVNGAGNMSVAGAAVSSRGIWITQGVVSETDWFVGWLGVKAEYAVDCNNASGDQSCNGTTVLVDVFYYDAFGGLISSGGDTYTYTGSSGQFTGSGPYITAPAAARHVTMTVAVTFGAATLSGTSTSFNHVSAVALRITFDPADVLVDNGPVRCPDGTVKPAGPEQYPGQLCRGHMGTGTVDAGGNPVCGPVSGDCTKPFIGAAGLPQCTAPTSSINPLDWFGWLGCLLSIIPTLVYNVAVVPVMNLLIDMFFAGQTMGIEWAAFQADVGTRFPVSWVGPLTDAATGAMGDLDGGGSLPTTVHVFGVTFSPYVGAGSVTDPLVTWRPVLVSMAWLWFVFFAIKRVGAFVGSGGGSHVSIDNPGPG